MFDNGFLMEQKILEKLIQISVTENIFDKHDY